MDFLVERFDFELLELVVELPVELVVELVVLWVLALLLVFWECLLIYPYK